MIPVLQDLAKTNERDCVQAIFIYPLNALMKSQQKRIDAWCKAFQKRLPMRYITGKLTRIGQAERLNLFIRGL